ncbi:MAG: PspC domain-containing protein [Flavobacteriaceae bacterium]|nr:PspC domain-containing protein [Flavobacteriaceae bacterium]
MNKTININLGGMFFHIDEAAYQKLNRYLNAIRKSLSDDPQGRDEIIKDIELRISELLSDKIVDQRQVVSEADIDTIIGIMGQPEDYNVDEELFTEQAYTQKRRKNSKKLYRDVDDKFLGGVASGTAHYVGIEPIWSRIFWLIMAFGFGFGFLAYPLLWILLPKAESTSEKLEMEGERVNIDNIERKIREEFDSLSVRVKDGANELSETVKDGANNIKKKYGNKSKSGFQELLDTVGTILITILKVFAKFIGVLIIIVSALTLLGLIIGAFSWGSLEFLGFGDQFLHYPSEIFHSALPYWLIVLFFFIAIAIPFVLLFMLGLKILSNNAKSFSKVTSLTLLALWIISILGLIFSGLDISSRYKYKGLDTKTQNIEIIANDTLKISMVLNDDFMDTKHIRHNRRLRSINDNGVEKLYSTDVDFDIRKSDSDVAYIKIRKEAQGRNYSDANTNAEKLEYQFNLTNSNLKLDGYFLNGFKNTFFGQEVDVILYLPEGATIYLDKSTRNYLDDVSNKQNIYDKRMIDHYYIMGKNQLDCLDCKSNKIVDVDSENVKLKIDKNGVKLNITTDDGDVKVKIDENGIVIK